MAGLLPSDARGVAADTLLESAMASPAAAQRSTLQGLLHPSALTPDPPESLVAAPSGARTAERKPAALSGAGGMVVRRSHLAAALGRVKQRTATEVGAPQVRVQPYRAHHMGLAACVLAGAWSGEKRQLENLTQGYDGC